MIQYALDMRDVVEQASPRHRDHLSGRRPPVVNLNPRRSNTVFSG